MKKYVDTTQAINEILTGSAVFRSGLHFDNLLPSFDSDHSFGDAWVAQERDPILEDEVAYQADYMMASGRDVDICHIRDLALADGGGILRTLQLIQLESKKEFDDDCTKTNEFFMPGFSLETFVTET